MEKLCQKTNFDKNRFRQKPKIHTSDEIQKFRFRLLASTGPLCSAFFGEVVDPDHPTRAYAWNMLFCVGTTTIAFLCSLLLNIPKAEHVNTPPMNEWRKILLTRKVEEKFEKYFGYLARCEGKFCI